MELQKEDVNKTPWFGIIILMLLVILAWYGWGYYLRSHYPNQPELHGLIGDSYGGIGSLFSGLALAGMVVAIYLQSKELRMQREELTHQREEFKRTAEAQEKTEKVLRVSAEIQALNTNIIEMKDKLTQLIKIYNINGGTPPDSFLQEMQAAIKESTRLVDRASKLQKYLEIQNDFIE